MRLEDIQMTVRGEVSNGQAHARLFLAVLAQRHARFQALLGERAVAVVVEQQAGRGPESRSGRAATRLAGGS